MKVIVAKNQQQIFAVINIRKEVFVIEQHVDINLELDELDYTSIHYLIIVNNQPVGCARSYLENGIAHIGRVAVLKDARGKGYARSLLKHVINDIFSNGYKTIHIGAQVQALPFYQKLGFVVCGELYFDADIEHYPMELKNET